MCKLGWEPCGIFFSTLDAFVFSTSWCLQSRWLNSLVLSLDISQFRGAGWFSRHSHSRGRVPGYYLPLTRVTSIRLRIKFISKQYHTNTYLGWLIAIFTFRPITLTSLRLWIIFLSFSWPPPLDCIEKPLERIFPLHSNIAANNDNNVILSSFTCLISLHAIKFWPPRLPTTYDQSKTTSNAELKRFEYIQIHLC